MARLVRAVWYTNWCSGPDIGTGQKRVRRLGSTIDQTELVVNSGTSVARYRDISGFARGRLVGTVGYADWRPSPYICAGEKAIGNLDCTVYEVVLGFDRRAGVTCSGYVGRLACWRVVWAVWDADGGPCPDIAAVQELVGLLDSTTHKVIFLVECVTGVTSNRDVSRRARRRW